MMELNQKLTKHSQKTLDTGRLHGEIKEEGVCSKGAYSRELTGYLTCRIPTVQTQGVGYITIES